MGTTGASSNTITDSAAAATAFATGRKTFNGALGVMPREDPAAADTVTKKLHQVLYFCRLYE
jgi:alkaline phosphatase